jgi:DNA-binding MarR family transcriptional regulator
MTNSPPPSSELVDAIVEAANVLLGVAARSVVNVESTVSSPQLRVLVFVALRGPQSAGAIAKELDVHPSNATRICDRLIRMGMLVRTEGLTDRRFVKLELTESGASLVEGVFRSRRAAIAHVVGSIPAETRDGLAEAFRTFALAAAEDGSTDGRFALSLP